MMLKVDPFPTVRKLASEIGEVWSGYDLAAEGTIAAEEKLRQALVTVGMEEAGGDRLLNADASLVLCGSFARREMLEGSDYDWTLLIDGVVDNNHSDLARKIASAVKTLNEPGSSGTFGEMVFSHDLVHKIGGGADSNANLTRRMSMLLESRPFSLSAVDSSDQVWENVLRNILERYFEEDVHFTLSPGKQRVPRFLLNDLTRYWRTICVDYAAKHKEQDGKKWAIRNAKLRFSRKLLFASGLAFCLSCELSPPNSMHADLFGATIDPSARPFIDRARAFARTPALEYLAAFVESFVSDAQKRKKLAKDIFGTYEWWLRTIGSVTSREQLKSLDHKSATSDSIFQEIRNKGLVFAMGLEYLFFNHTRDQQQDKIANLTMEYIGF